MKAITTDVKATHERNKRLSVISKEIAKHLEEIRRIEAILKNLED